MSIAQVIAVLNQMEADGVENAAIDLQRFERIVRQHGLADRWRSFKSRFPRGEQ